jgi:hypothetical protein
MMPVIRISDEVFNILQEYAVPLEDTPDSVLRRILAEYEKIKPRGTQHEPIQVPGPKPLSGKGKIQREREAKWIVNALTRLGDRAHPREVIEFIEETYSRDFTPADQETLPSGEIRGIKNVNWARFHMARKGLINPNSRRGVWELTEKGKTYFQE